MIKRADQPRRVAIVEDERALRENYALALQKEGYDVLTFENRECAIRSLQADIPDLVIVDVGLGYESDGGFELCRQLRALSIQLPILFLTARDSELDVISGLRLGADDYLTKDISLAHLAARVTALLRRTDALTSTGAATYDVTESLGPLQISAKQLAISWRGERVDLTVTEFWLIDVMARYPGQVKTRQQLMQAASVVLDDQTITAHIKRIRKKFIAIDEQFDCIQTVYGMGYRWVEDGSSG